MEIISSAGYAQTMDNEVLPYLAARRQSGTFERKKGEPLYYEHFTADLPVATLVLVHGFTEGIDKFRETVFYFLTAGYHVWIFQQREHGKSFRSTGDPDLICIRDYQDLVEDLHAFVTTVVKKPQDKTQGDTRKRLQEELPLYLFGHSMGGGVSACYLEQYPDDFSKAVLSSPMMALHSGGMPVWAGAAYAKLSILTGRAAAVLPGSLPFSGKPDFENSCTNCRERYEYWFREQKARRENQMCLTAVATAYQFLRLTRFVTDPKNTQRVKADVLLLQAGKDTMVAPGGQEKFIHQIGSRGKLVRFPDAKHEIYLGKDETLMRYWKEILAFLT